MSRDALEGRVALITGGAGGIGSGIGGVFLQKGAQVILGDNREVQLEKTAAALSREGKTPAFAYAMDVTDPESLRKIFDWAEQKFGFVDILVNCAGVCYAHPFLDGAEKAYQLTVDVNFHGVLRTSYIFAKRLIQQKRPGNIVNIASNAAKRPYERYVEYNATKAAVVNLTHTLSQELAPYNINVNAVCPGAVDTEMLAYCMHDAVALSNGAFDLDSCRRSWGPAQLGRLVQPEEVGWVAAFLASPAAHIVRGQAINVDAGDTPL